MEANNISETQAEKDIYREILRLFQCKEYEYRPAMCQPFFQENFVIATDAYKFVCFDKSLLKTIDFEPDPKAPDALKVLPKNNNCSLEFEVSVLKECLFKNLKAKTAEKYSFEKSNCPDCKGIGCVDYVFTDYKSKEHTVSEDCPTCIAKNYTFNLIKDKQTGKIVESFKELIKIEQSYFEFNNFKPLIMAAEMLDVDKVTLVFKQVDDTGGLVNKFLVDNIIVCLSRSYSVDLNIDVIEEVK